MQKDDRIIVVQKKIHRRAVGTTQHKKKPGPPSGDYRRPGIDRKLIPVFRRIGIPDSNHFTPDPFQVEAIDLIGGVDVLVSAPTGAGKTWIASQAINSYIKQDRRVWYASPLKALSNSIYQEFSNEFGPELCGILTGDRKENTDAPVLVGTTEILRNQLYDSMHEGTNIPADLVILDEAHYLNDPDRGVVWEEVLIYLTPRVRLLLLSATISNATQICDWLREIRQTPNRLVRSEGRPVPLELLFLFDEGLVVPLSEGSRLDPKVKKYLSKYSPWRARHKRVNFGNILDCLREFDLLPAIFFLKSRSDCDKAILTCHPVDKEKESGLLLKEDVDAFLNDYPHLKKHRQMDSLIASRVGSHHGGQLPYWKVLIEKMMNKGHLEAIFSTSTVAAGVNFPARTVVLMQSDRFNGREFVDLTATEFHQIIGRAGRRGKDHIGFGLIIPGFHQDVELINSLKNSPPEPVLSQININFSMTLNLLLSHTPAEVKQLLDLSLAAFQEKEKDPNIKRRREKLLDRLKDSLPGAVCDVSDPYEIMENIQKGSELQRQIRRLTRGVFSEQRRGAYEKLLQPGRLFLHKNGDIYTVIHTHHSDQRLICAARNIKEASCPGRKGERLKKVDLNQIRKLFDYTIEIPGKNSARQWEAIVKDIPINKLKTIRIEIPSKDQIQTKSLNKAEERLRTLPCEHCDHFGFCKKKKGAIQTLLREFRSLEQRTDGKNGGLWLSFKRHLRFLRETGFVDDYDQLTPDGYWASKLRLDQPLLIAEAIRKGAFDNLSPEIMAGVLAPFVWDKVQETEIKNNAHLSYKELEWAFNRILAYIEDIVTLKKSRGFESPQIVFWPSAALFIWARRLPWEELLDCFPVSEGDMASLIMRTADHLRQVANLRQTHSGLASTANEAIQLILREPVYIF